MVNIIDWSTCTLLKQVWCIFCQKKYFPKMNSLRKKVLLYSSSLLRNHDILLTSRVSSISRHFTRTTNFQNDTKSASHRVTCREQKILPVFGCKRSNSSHSGSLDSPYRLITCTQQDGLRKIVMNDKKTRNALSLEMMRELLSAINTNKSDPNLRCILLTASTDAPVFSSGHNLKELTSENGLAAQKNIFATCSDLMMSIRNAEVPVFCVVRGLAAAAGCQLVAACDFSVVSDKATFSTPGANFGIFCSTPGVAVSRAANKVTAAYMVLTGQSLNASEALNSGLVAKVVPDEDLDKTVQQIYSSIKSKSRSVIQVGRKFFYEQLEMPYEKALREGESVMVENLQMKDGQEGLKSFKEKRHPVWSHNTERTEES